MLEPVTSTLSTAHVAALILGEGHSERPSKSPLHRTSRVRATATILFTHNACAKFSFYSIVAPSWIRNSPVPPVRLDAPRDTGGAATLG